MADATRKALQASNGGPDVHVYLEYYQWGMLDHYNTLLASVSNPRTAWARECGNPATAARPSNPADLNDTANVWLPEDANVLDLSTVDPAVVMRILISWTSVAGGTRWFEMVVTRRK